MWHSVYRRDRVVANKRNASHPAVLKRCANRPTSRVALSLIGALLGACLTMLTPPVAADEPRLSAFTPKLVALEDFLYVWTSGEEGVGDGQDKLVTIDVRPQSITFTKVIHVLAVGRGNEPASLTFSSNRGALWATGLASDRIFIFDILSDPSQPRLSAVIDDLPKVSGGIRAPHAMYALPGRMLVAGLGNTSDATARTGIAEFTSEGHHVTTHWVPAADDLRGAFQIGRHADGAAFDLQGLVPLNLFLSTSFDGHLAAAGNTPPGGASVTVWDLFSREPLQVFDVPGGPGPLACPQGPEQTWCFTVAVATGHLWLLYADDDAVWQAEDLGPVARDIVVDLSLSGDGDALWITTGRDGRVHLYDVTNPQRPVLRYSARSPHQLGSVVQTMDGTRLYFGSASVTAGTSAPRAPHHVTAMQWDGVRLLPRFSIDFRAAGLGLPRQMQLGSVAFSAAFNALARSVEQSQ